MTSEPSRPIWRPQRKIKWVLYAKRPFGGPLAVLAYLSRYTHRVAISNRRLVAADDGGVSFRWKDYRIEGPGRWKTMTLTQRKAMVLELPPRRRVKNEKGQICI
jgi:hypothetical protein